MHIFKMFEPYFIIFSYLYPPTGLKKKYSGEKASSHFKSNKKHPRAEIVFLPHLQPFGFMVIHTGSAQWRPLGFGAWIICWNVKPY